MKKRYNLMLDEENVEQLKKWLAPKGINFSGYMNSLLTENMEAIKILEGVEDLKDLNIGQLTKLYAGMAKGFEKSKTKGKKKK